jgi:TetR/AcrR family transcriptional repressor of nem operon
MRYPAEETAAKHERIVREASRLFRERGFEDVTVGEVMKAAGLTHGAFYAHFDSKQALQEAAVAYGQALSAGRMRSHGATKKGRKAYADSYLSPGHRDSAGDGCTMASLAQEVSRSSPEIKAAFEQGLEEILAASGLSRKEAIVEAATLLGGIVLARAVRNTKLSGEILAAVREKVG